MQIVPDVVQPQKLASVAPEVMAVDAARLMADRRIGANLLVSGDRMIGIITERDIAFKVVAGGLDPRSTPVSAVMTKDPQTIGPHAHPLAALELMQKGRFRHLPVFDDGAVIGIVSIRDLYHAVKQELEEALLEREAFISGGLEDDD
jgi:CBS domain-containing protein